MHPTHEVLTPFHVTGLVPPWMAGEAQETTHTVRKCAHVGQRFVVLCHTCSGHLWFVYYVDLERRAYEHGGYGHDTDPDSDGSERFAFYLDRMLEGRPVWDDHAPRLLLEETLQPA